MDTWTQAGKWCEVQVELPFLRELQYYILLKLFQSIWWRFTSVCSCNMHWDQWEDKWWNLAQQKTKTTTLVPDSMCQYEGNNMVLVWPQTCVTAGGSAEHSKATSPSEASEVKLSSVSLASCLVLSLFHCLCLTVPVHVCIYEWIYVCHHTLIQTRVSWNLPWTQNIFFWASFPFSSWTHFILKEMMRMKTFMVVVSWNGW